MKRSDINNIILQAADTFARFGQSLPPFACWSPEELLDKREDGLAITQAGLGWDVTDYGQGRFDMLGQLSFTLRNGSLSELAGGAGRVYAEKLVLLRDGQAVPTHSHLLKTEDLINRGGGGGVVIVQLCGSDDQGGIDRQRGVTVECDGLARWVRPNDTIRLEPGESVTLRPGDWHSYHAAGGDCVVAQVSTVIDERNDNLFDPPMRRFPQIEEDCAPVRLLIGDYPTHPG